MIASIRFLLVPAAILGIVSGADSISRLMAGSSAQVILDSTPFYAEGGGQVGDSGFLEWDMFAPPGKSSIGRAEVTNTVKTPQGVITSSKTIAMFDCVKQTVAVKENTYYYDESRNRIYQHSAPKLPGFATTIRNTLADIALHHLCAPPAK